MASPAPEFVLAYDANCGPCSRFKAAVKFLDAPRRIRFVSLEEADESGQLARISPASRHASFHLIHLAGSSTAADVRSGSEAILPLMRILSPRGRWVSRAVEAVPGGAVASLFAYSALSRLHRGCAVQRG